MRSNSRRLELLYVSGSHSLAPDVFELAEAAEGKDAAAKLEAARPMDPAASGENRGSAKLAGGGLHSQRFSRPTTASSRLPTSRSPSSPQRA